MKDYFPLKTTQPDAVVARLNEIYDELKMMDVTYDDDVATFEFTGNVIFTGDATIGGAIGYDSLDISGNADIGGDLDVTGSISGGEIVEKMEGYAYAKQSEIENITREFIYAGVVKNGNKLTFVVACNITRTGSISDDVSLGIYYLPTVIANKLYQTSIGTYSFLSSSLIQAFEESWISKSVYCYASKVNTNYVRFVLDGASVNTLDLNKKYYVRVEVTFLLSDNLVPQE